MKKILFLFAMSLLVFILNAQNLLVNPGFENWTNGKPLGWAISNAGYISQNTVNYSEGTKSCKSNVQSTNSTVNISQNIAVTAGKTYSFRVSYFVERGDGTDAKILCYFKNSANKAIPMNLSDSLALKGPGGNSAFFPTELGVWKTYTCDIVAPVGATVFVFYVRSAAYSIVSWDDFFFGINSTPTIYTTNTELSGFNYAPGNGPSNELSTVVKGSNLAGSITVTAPTDYEISTLSGASFNPKSTIILPQTNGVVNSTTIYVRLKSDLSANTYSGNLTIASTGVQTLNVSLTGSVSAPPVLINTSLTSLSSFSYNENAGPSGIKSFNVSGSGLLSGITISAPDNYEISIFGGASFLGSNTFTISQSGGFISTTTIYVRLKSGLSAGSYSGNISLSTVGTASKSVSLTGAVNAIAELTVSTTALTGFRYEPNNGPSTEQSFTVSGKGMTTALVISAPVNYEISTETGSNFSGTSQLIIPQSGGIINTMPIYVRLKASLSEAIYTGNLSLQTGGGINKSISLSGIVSVPIELNLSTTVLSGFNYKVGYGPSIEKMFTLSAKGLISSLIVSAPENYEISTGSGVAFVGNNQLIFTLNAGSVPVTNIYVRLKSELNESNNYSGNITVSSGLDVTENIAVNGYVIGTPQIIVSTSSINDFSYYIGNGPSESQLFNVSGSGLTDNIQINAPIGYELSTLSGVDFYGSDSLTLNVVNGYIPLTSIYVRLKSGLPVDTYNGELQVYSTDVQSSYISVSGNVLLSTDYQNLNRELKIFSTTNNIIVCGVQENQTIELYSYTGKLLQSVKSLSDRIDFPVQNHSVYIVKIGNQAYKYVFQSIII